MLAQHQYVTISIGILFMVFILDLVRKKKMREMYSILWFVMGVGFIVLATWEGLLVRITALMGAKFPASVLFFLGLLFVLIVLIHFSVEISSLRRQNNTLNQYLALLTSKIDAMTPEQKQENKNK